MGLSLARDEFLWLLRHHDNPPLKGKSGKQLEEFFTDRQVLLNGVNMIEIIYCCCTSNILL